VFSEEKACAGARWLAERGPLVEEVHELSVGSQEEVRVLSLAVAGIEVLVSEAVPINVIDSPYYQRRWLI
jgi:hypothetical protein